MRSHHFVVALITLVFGIVGCGRSASAPPAKPATPPATPTVPTATAEESTAGTPIAGPTGKLEGTVRWVGEEIPQPEIVTNGTDPQICGAEMSKVDVVISPDSRGIKNVLLWLEGVTLPEGYKPPTQLLVVDNVKCQFQPHAAVLTVGSSVQAKNSDAVLHTTHFYGKALDVNPGLPEKGSVSQPYKLRTPGVLNVKCDKHGWMQAYVRVDPHPFHAVTDADGKFAIADVPVGTYKLQLWHERFLKQEIELTVKENETTALQLSYPAAEPNN